MLETRQLQQLVAVADHGTVTEAAESLYLTQPALSRSLKRIEIELGVGLFDRRKKNSLELNEAGLLAAERAREILEQLDDMARLIKDNDRMERAVAVGACSPPLLWSAVPALASAFPGKAFSSVLDSTAILEKRLLKGELQVAFLGEAVNAPHIECFEWEREKLCATFPVEYPLHDVESVTFAELNGQSILLQSHIGDWENIARRMMPDSELLFQEDRSILMTLATDSALPTFMSNFTMAHTAVPEGRAVVPVVGEGSELPLWCAYQRDVNPEIVNYLKHYSTPAKGV